MFEGTSSSELVVRLAVLVKVWPALPTDTTRTGTVTSSWAPSVTVPRLHENAVDPAAPVQVFSVLLPEMATTLGAPVSSIPAGNASVSTTSSASARPGPVLFTTVIL